MKNFFKNQRLTAGLALLSLVLLIITAIPSLHAPKWIQIMFLLIFLVCAVTFTIVSSRERFRDR